MATRSTIARLIGNEVESIYCHFDGYPEGVGATLSAHYTDPLKIARLMSLGDVSVLAEEIGESNDFDNPTDNVCLFYGRDRNEDGVDALSHKSVSAWLAAREDNGCEYAYFWNGLAWETFQRKYDEGWVELRENDTP